MNSKTTEQAIDYIVKEFNLLPFQEQIIREMWQNKRYLVPVRASGWSTTSALLMMIDVLLRKENKMIHKLYNNDGTVDYHFDKKALNEVLAPFCKERDNNDVDGQLLYVSSNKKRGKRK